MSKLTLLSGQVKNLKIQRVSKSVFSSNNPQKLAEVGALTAAALGSVYASSVMASSRLKMTHEVEFFSCEINGVNLVGCFGEVTFMNNHNLEFVVEYLDEGNTEAIAHAARNIQKKIIWISPYQNIGESANQNKTNRHAFIFCMSLMFFLFFLMIVSELTEEVFDLYFIGWASIIILAGCPILALMFKLISRVEIKDARQATRIFEAFGYQKPSEVDLFENNLDIQLEMEDEAGKPLPDMPQWIYRYRDSDLMGD